MENAELGSHLSTKAKYFWPEGDRFRQLPLYIESKHPIPCYLYGIYGFMYSFIQVALAINLDTAGKKREILHYVDEITFAVNNIEDTNVLDRMLSLLMQAASSSKVCTREETSQTFTIKDKFAPAQKNETQLRFKKTCADSGRKTKASTMRYVE